MIQKPIQRLLVNAYNSTEEEVSLKAKDVVAAMFGYTKTQTGNKVRTYLNLTQMVSKFELISLCGLLRSLGVPESSSEYPELIDSSWDKKALKSYTNTKSFNERFSRMMNHPGAITIEAIEALYIIGTRLKAKGNTIVIITTSVVIAGISAYFLMKYVKNHDTSSSTSDSTDSDIDDDVNVDYDDITADDISTDDITAEDLSDIA